MANFPSLSLGPNYPYWDYIKSPSQIGISTKGTFNALAADVKGLMAYSDILISGSGPASATGRPLGNQYFLNSGGQCCSSPDVSGNCSSDDTVDRYIYINNIPDGSIPFISNDMSNSPDAPKGLLIGILEDVGVLDPFTLFSAFTGKSTPSCRQITLQTTDVSNNVSQGTQYVADSDITSINPCLFTDNPYNSRINPVSNAKCEGFSNIGLNNNYNNDFPTDPIIQLYFFLILILGLYILYKVSYT